MTKMPVLPLVRRDLRTQQISVEPRLGIEAFLGRSAADYGDDTLDSGVGSEGGDRTTRDGGRAGASSRFWQVHRGSASSIVADTGGRGMTLLLKRIGVLTAQTFRQTNTLGYWSLKIPVAPDLLPATVLLLAYSPMQVSIHFDTQDWDVRDLVRGRSREFEQIIRERLAPEINVVITV